MAGEVAKEMKEKINSVASNIESIKIKARPKEEIIVDLIGNAVAAINIIQEAIVKLEEKIDRAS